MMKRLQGVSVTGQMVAAAFPEGTIPQSARFMHAYFDYERNVFVCVFEDGAFAEVPEGCRIPIDVDNHVQGVPWIDKPLHQLNGGKQDIGNQQELHGARIAKHIQWETE